MGRTAKLVLGVAAVVVLALFLLPVVPITVASPYTEGTPRSLSSYQSASASMMYAYFGVGAVSVPNPNPLLTGSAPQTYCLAYGNPGVMCGYPLQRMNPMMTP